MKNEDTTESEDVDSDPSQLKAARRLFEHWLTFDYEKRKKNDKEELNDDS